MTIGVYTVGAPVGIMLASLVGGAVAQHPGWRTALLVAGLPGLVLAVVAWRSLHEPVHGALTPLALDLSSGRLVRGGLRRARYPVLAFTLPAVMAFAYAGRQLLQDLVPWEECT
jgi:MFS family permease